MYRRGQASLYNFKPPKSFTSSKPRPRPPKSRPAPVAQPQPASALSLTHRSNSPHFSHVDSSGFFEVYEVPSDSDPNTKHEVKLWIKDSGGFKFKKGNVSCDCMAWRFQKHPVNERECKHTKRVAASLTEQVIRA